jgi:CheY-like chemotaxis protein
MRILLADDQAEMRLLLRHWLAEPGWEVQEVRSGEELLARRDEDFDVFVVDHLMPPGIDGLETARRLRTAGDQRPILVISSFVAPPLAGEAAEIGVELAAKEDLPGLAARVGELGG